MGRTSGQLAYLSERHSTPRKAVNHIGCAICAVAQGPPSRSNYPLNPIR